MRAREVVGGRAQVHFGVVPDKVFEVHERAREPQAGADSMRGVRRIHPSDRARAEALVEARQTILGGRERAGEAVQGSGSGIT